MELKSVPTIYTYDVTFTNHAGRSLHIFVIAQTNVAAIRDAMAQLDGWGDGSAITRIDVDMIL